eukprot:CAMPEP_0117653056 /NCGR_PEP_ID=MMETSP0804-20121206/2983_1 /TAXON_ID=1074897 /ORGANISM="Tetraselmis astigmatica, Strain CCMP880" /LENGTH=75 /DNA_ID=CAMNT_0005459197 /DNA_START=35 /DNA_END=259 /DNA_ORIENTATION=-
MAGGGFGYSTLSPELMTMTEELELLGGGDARVSKLQVCCKVAAVVHGERVQDSIIMEGEEGLLSVADPRCPTDAP